ncbi:organelle RRM domain-containing protein 6, chloroplastic isoform X2 [Cucumis sativus]|uniref:organelle RRM domain-containing protein 6, chloroplastic isoform X2 n=1 Tax=Cucumis sativus TaxID=3659 RepID=UPI0005EC6EC3|nr:organelle RRM domain-containing protein 6, chloroplastic isoform X2 [Cucumis sativus]
MTAGLSFTVTAAPKPFFQLQTTHHSSISSTETRMRIRSIQSKLAYSSTPLPFFSARKTQSISDSLLFSVACVSSSPSSSSSPRRYTPSTRLYISGLSFRTTEESLRNAFKSFGQLVEVNLVMDRLANRPRGFAFLRYASEEESQKAIEGMHGKVYLMDIPFPPLLIGKHELI